MFDITMLMILVWDGVDGMRHVWMTLGSGCGKNFHKLYLIPLDRDIRFITLNNMYAIYVLKLANQYINV